jgi:site-specific DNA recombinase
VEKKQESKVYHASIYVRLSREDGDKVESDSITNQRELIREFLKSKLDIQIVSERIDDGYSGVDFNRPAFNLMIEDIKSKKINCVVVKDLSRFGRDYIEAGRYIEKIFPFLGVRFIAINDNFDSSNERSQSDSFIIPFKNLMNDAYCRDISIKIRSQLELKRKKGDFTGPFAVFGYIKSEENKNKLMIDEFAASIVKDVFKMKIDGMSQQRIAERLNEMGIPSPLVYKKMMGLAFSTGFSVSNDAKWSAVAVGRILKNEMYTGIMEQGKKSAPNHKIKKRIERFKDEWIRVENILPAIISNEEYEMVNSLLIQDTRVGSNEQSVFLFAGILICVDCNQNMVRKTIPSGEKKYVYYVCSTNKANKTCSSHRIRNDLLENAVLSAIRIHIENILCIERILEFIDTLPLKQEDVQKISHQILKKEGEVEKFNQIKLSLYEDYVGGLIDKSEFVELKGIYTKKAEEAENAIHRLKEEIEKTIHHSGSKNLWIESFKKHKNVTELTRKTVVMLIERIYVYEDSRIDIKFRYQYDYDQLVNRFNNIEKIKHMTEYQSIKAVI